MKNAEVVSQDLSRTLHLKRLRNVTLLIIYAIFAFYFLVNGEALFDEWTSTWTWSTVIYLVGVSLFLGIQEKLPKSLGSSLTLSAIGLLVSFFLATGLFLILRDFNIYFTGVEALPIKQILPVLLYQLVIVVCSEEIIFRGVIFGFFYQFHWILAVIISAILFSLFHYAVYQSTIGAFTTAFVMGIVFAMCVKRWNIGVAIGLHFAWNAFVLGATALI